MRHFQKGGTCKKQVRRERSSAIRRKRSETAVLESEEKYRALFNQSVAGIYLHDMKGCIVDVNNAACAQSGYSREELLEVSVLDLFPGDIDRDEVLHLWSQWKPEIRYTIETEHRRKDGVFYPVEVSTGIIRYSGKDLLLAL